MYNREASALLKFWTLISNLTVLSACLRILLNLLFLTTFPSASFSASAFAGFRRCCWLGCCHCPGRLSSLFGGGGTFHFGNFFKRPTGPAFRLARPSWTAGLSFSGYQSFEQCSLASEVPSTSSLRCFQAGDLFIQNKVHRSGLFCCIGVDRFEDWQVM